MARLLINRVAAMLMIADAVLVFFGAARHANFTLSFYGWTARRWPS